MGKRKSIEGERPLQKRTLRAMRSRWERDLTRLETAYPVDDWEADSPRIETIRNLATAIAQIDGIITATPPNHRGTHE